VDRSQITDYAVLLQKVGCSTQGVYTFITKNWSNEMFGESHKNQEEDDPDDEYVEQKYRNPLSSGWI
jgi:hypothetical protein